MNFQNESNLKRQIIINLNGQIAKYITAIVVLLIIILTISLKKIIANSIFIL